MFQNRNKQFLDSRRDDPAVKEREQALQSLDLAYFKYREITRNLDEGFKVSGWCKILPFTDLRFQSFTMIWLAS